MVTVLGLPLTVNHKLYNCAVFVQEVRSRGSTEALSAELFGVL